MTLAEKAKVKCPYLSSTFVRIYDDYAARNLKGPRTNTEYQYIVFSLCNYAKKDFLVLEAGDISGYLYGTLKEGRVLTNNNYVLRVIRAICRYIDENALIYHVTPQYLHLTDGLFPEIDDMVYDLDQVPDLRDVNTVLSYSSVEDVPLFIACGLVLRCSLTSNEVIRLERTNFFQDLNGNYGIRMKLTDYADRFIKVPEDIAEIIKKYALTRKDDIPALLITQRRTPMTIRTLQNRMRCACQACGVASFTLNSLRILSVAYMLKGGATTEKVAEYLDSKNTNWIFRYNRVVSELEDAACDYSHLRIVGY